jgi:anti-sigma factor ChrR (cupin superfamily)
MAAVTPNAKLHLSLGPLASRFVRVDELPWEETRFPGIRTKTLLFDREAGTATVLMEMAPGAVLPDHEHVLIEQTYVLRGRLVDKEGPDESGEVAAGDFVWRPAGSRHAAWTPEGGLMLAIFQVPNRFHEKDGRTVDLLGRDWDEMWKGAARKG